MLHKNQVLLAFSTKMAITAFDLSEIFLELGLELTETELGHILEQLDTDGSWRVDVHSLRLCFEAAVGAAATAPL